MSETGYTIETNGAVALAAATAKTVLNVIGVANATFQITEFAISFDGASSTAVPVLVELCRSTQATAGTSTAATVHQGRGPTRTAQCSGAVNYTAEPTVLTTYRRWLVHPQAGMVMQFPLGREPDQSGAAGLALRVTAPAAVNCQGHIEFEEG